MPRAATAPRTPAPGHKVAVRVAFAGGSGSSVYVCARVRASAREQLDRTNLPSHKGMICWEGGLNAERVATLAAAQFPAMRSLATLAIWCLPFLLTAQDCYFTFLTEQGWQPGQPWQTGRRVSLHPSGNVSFSLPSFGMGYGQLAPDGALLWDRRVVHNNPSTIITPYFPVPRPGGGHLLHGRFEPADNWFDNNNPCIVAVAPNGAADWARIYMTDSTDMGGSGLRIFKLDELPSGDIMMTGTARQALALARLGPDGVPIWHKRYLLPGSGFALTTISSLVEPDGSMTVVGMVNQGDMSLVRVAGDGSVVWSYAYAMSGSQYPTGMVKAADGTYFVSSGYTGALGFLTHFNSDGTLDWQKRLNAPPARLQLLNNGDLLASGGVDAPGLMRISPAGVVLQTWTTMIPGTSHELIAARNDSVFVLHRDQVNQSDSWSALNVGTTVDNLTCAFNPADLPLSFQEPMPTLVSSTITSFPDQMKTWTMNVGFGLTVAQLDVQAAASSGPARPGFTYTVYTDALNNGGTVSGTLTRTLTFDPLLTYESASLAPTTVTANTLTWTGAAAVAGYDNSPINVQFTVPPDVQLLGTELTTTFTASQGAPETDLANNTTTITRIITGSYDPNDKLVQPAGMFNLETDTVLNYTIRFQNTGNDTAFTVVVLDTLPPQVDAATFRLGATSHPCTYTLAGSGIITFTFADILLPDSNTNEALSHGLVDFSARPMQPVALGQVITNTADIYFDFNPPIHTPEASVVVVDETGISATPVPGVLSVYPVPARAVLSAVLPEGFRPQAVVAIGMDGRRLPLTRTATQRMNPEWNVEHLAPGTYVLQVTDAEGQRLAARFTKE